MIHQTGIYLLDDNELVLESMRKLIDRESDMRVLGCASAGQTALSEIAALNPDVAVIDLSLGDTDGLDIIRTVKKAQPHVRVLVLSMHDEGLYGLSAVKAGASGYLMKQNSIENIIPALRSVASGNSYVSDRLQAALGPAESAKLFHGNNGNGGNK